MPLLTAARRSLLQKGIFAVSTVALIGTSGMVAFAVSGVTPQQTGNGYGSGSDAALAAIDRFTASCADCDTAFHDRNTDLFVTLRTKLTNNNATDTYAAQFDAATGLYETNVSTATATFRSAVQAGAIGGSKDRFIDSYNHAKADYLNALDAAKNQLADTLSKMSSNGNVAKDQFMNGFNSQRDIYSNCLEDAKNTFAATLG